ncbi:hypothetical protein ACFQ2B_02195 [Streptomyces stramineus]
MCASVVAAVRATQPLAGPLTAEIHPRRSAGADMASGRDAMAWMQGALPTLAAVVEQAAASGDPDAVALAVDIVTLVPCFEDVVPLAPSRRARPRWSRPPWSTAAGTWRAPPTTRRE